MITRALFRQLNAHGIQTVSVFRSRAVLASLPGNPAKNPRTSRINTCATKEGETHENAVFEALKSRRTIGDFTDDVVSDDVVTRAVEAARWAPNHKLTEPWKFYWLGGEAIEEISKLNAALLKADGKPAKAKAKYERWRSIKGWLVVTSRRSLDNALMEQEDYAATCCAVQNLLLALHSEGVGTKWTTGAVTRTAEVAKVVGYDLNEEAPVGIVWYGVPAREGKSLRRKQVADILIRVP